MAHPLLAALAIAGVYMGARAVGKTLLKTLASKSPHKSGSKKAQSGKAKQARNDAPKSVPTLSQDPETGVYHIDESKKTRS